MPLIEPGKYELSYNQDYLLKKLYLIDIIWSYAGLIVLFLFIIGIIITVIRINKEHNTKNKEDDFLDRWSDFIAYVNAMEGAQQVMGDLGSEINERIYYPELREKIQYLIPYEKEIFKRYGYKHNLNKWIKYKELLMPDLNKK